MTAYNFTVQLLYLMASFMLPVLTTFGAKLLYEQSKGVKFKNWRAYASLVVTAVEETMGSGNGALKKRQVELFLANKLKGISADEIDTLIQAAVNEMNKVIKGDGNNANK